MSDPVVQIMETLATGSFIESTYPILTSWGVNDEDVFVHSIGCSVWNTLGQHLGYMPVIECPAPSAHGADIRTDSTWFSLKEKVPFVLIEFERFDGTDRGQKKLEEKLCNLIEASVRWERSPSVLVLSVWSKGVVSALNKERLIKICRNGFKSTAGVAIQPYKSMSVILNRLIFEIVNTGQIILKQTRCERLL
ncbi:MAG: hypothetical protein GX639_19620 [Fibrobacter sp.]|nr:hypothetical protein [Fibrobacter sp.]